MSLAIFNINDAGIQLTLDGDLVRTSPGYAVMNNDALIVGESASRQAKLLPRWTNTRFWSQLDTNPLTNGTSKVRHHADIAFAHLEDLWESVSDKATDTIFIVPGYYTSEHLGLLLGLAAECGMPIGGVVDHSVVAASNLPLRPLILHLDIHLHAVTLTRLTNNGSITRKQVSVPVEAGLFTLWDRWANIIAEQFIQTTRFDPMHTADTEQQLYDRLPEWIAGLGEAATYTFTLEAGGTRHTVSVSRDALTQACTSIYPQIVQAVRAEVSGESASLLLSHHLKGFPGLRESLSLVGNVQPFELAEMKAVSAARANAAEIIGEPGSISHVVQLHAGEVSADPVESAHTGAPSHLLWDNSAYPIGRGIKIDRDLSAGPSSSEHPACTIYLRNQDVTLEADMPDIVTVNGEPVQAAVSLRTGDRITIGSDSLTVISVINA